MPTAPTAILRAPSLDAGRSSNEGIRALALAAGRVPDHRPPRLGDGPPLHPHRGLRRRDPPDGRPSRAGGPHPLPGLLRPLRTPGLQPPGSPLRASPQPSPRAADRPGLLPRDRRRRGLPRRARSRWEGGGMGVRRVRPGVVAGGAPRVLLRPRADSRGAGRLRAGLGRDRPPDRRTGGRPAPASSWPRPR